MPPLPSPLPVALVGALHVGAERGLGAALRSAAALGLDGQPICTSLVMASHGHVTDVTEVPADTVAAAFEHLRRVEPPRGLFVGVLGGSKTVDVVFKEADRIPGPFVLDASLSGPSAETLLNERGQEALLSRWQRADVVLVRRRDAELLTGGEIRSLDDAQVAAQRAVRRGARRVLIRCGPLPARFFDADDPGAAGDGQPGTYSADVYYDGQEFALFEAPHIEVPPPEGGASALGVATLRALLDGQAVESALQFAKRYVTEAIRRGTQANGRLRLDYEWPNRT